ncbi:hypothetical protein [Nesterenkonia pannonica]|uniref:hypothetical protein n=1 Tax=Nesterenkonia pannonica TaxID=1548602 RepID=UPI0021640A8D|nr:hypothetical protein [Nesterenkonia pannonica]
MIADIVSRIDQASARADELEQNLMRQQAEASERLAAAEEAEEAAQQARTEAEAAMAVEDTEDDDTSAADVLLGDEDALADDATDQQLEDRAESDAVAAEQTAREAEAEAERLAEEAREAEASVDTSSSSTVEDVEELGANVHRQMVALHELEGEGYSLQEFYEMVLGNSDFLDDDGDVDYQALAFRVQQLRAEAEQAEVRDEDVQAE